MVKRKVKDNGLAKPPADPIVPEIIYVFLTIDPRNNNTKRYNLDETVFNPEDKERFAHGEREVTTSIGEYRLMRYQDIQNNPDLENITRVLTYVSKQSKIKF